MVDNWRHNYRWLMPCLTILFALVALFAMSLSVSATHWPVDSNPYTAQLQQPVNFDLLIVTPAEFVPALIPLLDHKNAHGMPARIITLEEIYEEFSGVDTPEQIKRAIDYYLTNNGVKYVMLVGDVNKFPVRWQLGTFSDYTVEQSSVPDDYVHAPADFYYADILRDGAFNSWDVDSDGYFGEIYPRILNGDRIDPHPDVIVGRVPAADGIQVETYVAKVIRYEFSPWGASRDLLLIQQEEFKNSVAAMEQIATLMASHGFIPTRLYEDVGTGFSGTADGMPIPRTIIAEINAGADLIPHITHGSPTQWQHDPSPHLEVSSVRNDLTNEEQLPLIFSAACSTARFYGEDRLPYQPYAPAVRGACPPGPTGGPHENPFSPLCGGKLKTGGVGTEETPIPAPIQTVSNTTSIAEAFLVDRDHGAIAYVGSIDTGEPHYSDHYHAFLGEKFFEAYDVGNTVLGDMWRYALEAWADEHNLETLTGNGRWRRTMMMHTPSRFHLLGDPSLRVGGIAGLSDNIPPETSVDGTAWLRASVTLSAVDYGSPPSGVRYTMYSLDGGSTWARGRSFDLPDGTHTIQFYSVDFAGNREATKTVEVHVDSTPPVTEALSDCEPLAMEPCPYGAECPPVSCCSSPITVELQATDNDSDVDQITYVHVDAIPDPLGTLPQIYSAPFEIEAFDLIEMHTIHYASVDRAGNAETRQTVEFCVSNARGGMWRPEAGILAGLEEIVMMTLRPVFADTLPPIASVQFEYAEVSQPQFTTIGIDTDGQDGWRVPFNTLNVPNGVYHMRMTVFGSSQARAGEQDQVLYQETLLADISNVPASAYTFALEGPLFVDGGESFQYDIKFHHTLNAPLTDLHLTLDLDRRFFDQLTILDGGFEDQQGRPAWYRDQLQPGDSWKVGVIGQVRGDVTPGSVIRAQAAFKSDTIPLLTSDNPRTAAEKDHTVVNVRLLDDAIAGHVLLHTHSAPIPATVTLTGASPYTTTVDDDGAYLFTGLTPGDYTVSAMADHYVYHTPSGPVSVTLQGLGETVAVDFHLQPVDERPPEVTLDSSLDEIVEQGQSSTSIEGAAIDIEPGSGVQSVELRIFDADDDLYWDGDDWSPGGTWLAASGTTAWTYDVSKIGWQSGHLYVVSVRATDYAMNVSEPATYSTTPVAPLLVAPANNSSTTNQRPTFDWMELPDAEYILQVDDNEDFSSPIIHWPDYLVRSDHTPSDDLPAGVYHWRVLTVSPAGVFGPWSDVWQVTVGLSTDSVLYLPFIMQ